MELLRALGALVELPAPGLEAVAGELELGELPSPADHTELFSFQLVPYASIYLDSSGMLGGEARDRIAGFWRVLEFRPPSEPDHLSTILAAQASWSEAGRRATSESERTLWCHRASAFLGDHLLSWLGPYLSKLEVIGAPSFYRRWAKLLRLCLEEESRRLVPAAGPSQHHRLSAPLGSQDAESPEALARALLTPVRSGLLLTRRDLARAARDLGLAGRIGERRFMLETIERQDPGGLRSWLLEEARATRTRYAAESGPLAGTFSVWSDRLEVTIELLGSQPCPSP